MDYSALHHEYGVEPTNVLDVQLVDVASRQTRGEGQPAQFRRLRKYLPYSDLYSNREAHQQVQKLSGLNECVQEHGVRTVPQRVRFFRLLVAGYPSYHCLITSGPYSLAPSAPSSVLFERRKC